MQVEPLLEALPGGEKTAIFGAARLCVETYDDIKAKCMAQLEAAEDSEDAIDDEVSPPTHTFSLSLSFFFFPSLFSSLL
jgi:hypothetical protein